MKDKRTYERTCPICGKPFVAHSPRAKFCGSTCRSRNHRGKPHPTVATLHETIQPDSPLPVSEPVFNDGMHILWKELQELKNLLKQAQFAPVIAPVSVQNAQHEVFVPSELKTISNAGNIQFSAPIDCDDLMGSLEIKGAKQDNSSVGNFLNSAGAMIKTKTAADFEQTAVVGKSRRAMMQ